MPYMVDPAYGNLGSKVFFIWGGLCGCSIFWAYFFVPETRQSTWLTSNLCYTEEVTARKSGAWKPHDNFTRATARKSELIEPMVTEKQAD